MRKENSDQITKYKPGTQAIVPSNDSDNQIYHNPSVKLKTCYEWNQVIKKIWAAEGKWKAR